MAFEKRRISKERNHYSRGDHTGTEAILADVRLGEDELCIKGFIGSCSQHLESENKRNL